MRSEGLFWAVVFLAVIGLGAVVAYGLSGAIVLILVGLGVLIMAGIGAWVRHPEDSAWLQRWIVLGFIAKSVGAFARYYMVQVIYGGTGDSLRYYVVGTELADIWRQGRVPPLTGSGSFGTQVVEAVTGAIFAVFTPDLLGGFMIFSMLSFLGQLGLYAAFRRWAQPHQLKPCAFFLFFLPTFAFWPSSIGKDALVMLFLGISAYLVSRLLEGYQLRWALALGIALLALGLVRVHIAGLVALALVGAALLSRLRRGATAAVAGRRLLTLVAGAAAGVLIIGLVPVLLGIDLAGSEDLTPFTSEIVRRTSESGTVVPGGPVTGLADVPGALALVLFRPYIFEATELQHYLAAAETTFLAALLLWKLPAILRNLRAWRANAYLVFATLYTISFAIAFSVVRNLGIIARQRGQVVAFFLAVVIGLGWERRARRQEAGRGKAPLRPVVAP